MNPDFNHRGYLLGNMYPQPANALKRLLLRLFSRKFLQAARFEKRFLELAVVRLFGPGRLDSQGKKYLNIAPGPHADPIFFNLDAFDYPGLDGISDCRRWLPFRDGVFKGVFTEHFIEHLDYVDEFGAFLAECHQVIEPGGTLRLVTPDAEKYFRSYVSGG